MDMIFDETLKSEQYNFNVVARRHNGEKAIRTSEGEEISHLSI